MRVRREERSAIHKRRERQRSRSDDRHAENIRDRNQRDPLPVVVLVHDLLTDEVSRELRMNLNDNGDRRWLLRLQLWALRERKSVEVLSKEDDELDREAGPNR